MKHTTKIAFSLAAILSIGATVQAYEFGFTNMAMWKERNGNAHYCPVDVRIKLSGINEPWYTMHLAAADSEDTGKTKSFNIRGRKSGFCLSQIQVMTYTKTAKSAGVFIPTGLWYDLAPHFVQTNYFSRLADAVSNVAEGATQTAGEIIKGVVGGSANPAGEVAASIGSAMAESAVGGLAGGIVKLVGLSFCKDRHFHIVADIDTNGKVGDIPLLLTNER